MNPYSSNQAKAEPPGKGAAIPDLLGRIPYSLKAVGNPEDQVISTVTCDSRMAGAGTLFIALPGTVTDGHRHLADAAARGCAAAVVQQGAEYHPPPDWQGWLVVVADCRQAYAEIAENYYGRPAERLKMIGITGTNGKTTITYLLEDAFSHLGYQVGVIGTVNYRYRTERGDSIVLPSPFTTPEAMLLQSLLFEMAHHGVELVIMEVSSHALAQQRIGNLRYDVAVFTNLSRDHLDFHPSMEAYFEAKQLLFANHLRPGGKTVISFPQQPESEVDWSGRLAQFCRSRQIQVLTCGRQPDAEVQLLDYRSSLAETQLRMRTGNRELKLATPLVGHFNMDNLLTAFTVIAAAGHRPEEGVAPLSASIGAPGRLQRVEADDGTGQRGPVVFVDYAHTPDALKQVLATLAALPHRQLYCVFGCGGDRDPGKRPVMGSIAASFADVSLVTDDNPRTEDPEKIRGQIVTGVKNAGMIEQQIAWLAARAGEERGFVVIGSRREAIRQAICHAGEGDIVLIAGKGHEKYQLGIDGKRFFDDCLEVRCALLSWKLETVRLATGGRLVATEGRKPVLAEVSTDSRTIRPGDIFVALKGERFDGHAFLETVAQKGAGCLVISATAAALPAAVARVEVDDTLEALGELARFRRRLAARYQQQVVIAITGSCGKTTVKEMTAAIMRRRWPAGPEYPEDAVLATRGNLNNLIGLPLTLLPITPRQRVAVLEMGMNAPGEIRAMARTAEPDICCITNVHGVHLAGLHDLAGVAAAKGELFAEAGQESILVVNLDDERVVQQATLHDRRKLTFSITNQAADLYVSSIHQEPEGVITFTLHHDGEAVQAHIYTVGLHNVANAAAAAAIASAAGMGLTDIAAGLADFRPGDRRMVRLKTAHGLGVLNDTYNANPASMSAGLHTLMQMGARHTAAMLGDMLELGQSAVEAHRQLGREVAELGVSYLGVVGELRQEVAEAALSAGMPPDRVRMFDQKPEAVKWLEDLQHKGELVQGDWLLVKASRGLRMETIVEALIQR